jgi:3-deoxy-D-manno-octulosonic-acid transferase
MSLPPGLTAYRLAAAALSPFAKAWLTRRAAAGKEDPARLGERFGVASAPRPPGRLVWLHGASLGEVKVALMAAESLRAQRPGLNLLITSATRTAAALAEAQAPKGAVHQYAPLDRGDAVARFLAHWRPDLGVFAESELWPNMLLGAHGASVKLALINARLSDKSLTGWARTPDSAARLLACFQLIAAADARTATGLTQLSRRPVEMYGNLKLAAQPLPADPAKLAALAAAIGGRPVWLAASTHPGEDEIALSAHALLRETQPKALLIIAPRHPDRANAIAALANQPPRRSRGDLPHPEHSVYLADTIGEMGLLYRTAPVTLLCGSLLPHLRGHNPIEPTALGSVTISGRHVDSFKDTFDALDRVLAIRFVDTADKIAAQVGGVWAAPDAARIFLARGQALIAKGAPALARVCTDLLTLLEARTHAPA